MGQFRAAWAARMAAKPSLTTSELWGLLILARGGDGPLSAAAAVTALDTHRGR